MQTLAPDFPMPDGYLWQYEVIRWVQSWASPWLDRAATGLTWLGLEGFYTLVVPILFWSVSKRIGLRLAYVFLYSMYANAWLKDWLQVLRPIGIPGIVSKAVATASGYALPSGHAQGPMTFWLMVCRWAQRRWLWMVALLLVVAIGWSRLYLGVHWPLDVLVGWGLGLLFALAGWSLGARWQERAAERSLTAQALAAVALPVVLMLVHTGPDSLKYAGLLLGLGLAVLAEGRWLRAELDPVWWKRVCAAVIGTAGLIALQYGIKWPAWPWLSAVQYALLGIWTVLVAPWVFVQCGLYQRRPE
ncbi:MAG: phosphatase PAP2 family protein [Alicyclobacillus sp.]|nr:phosphatase PAP2 family protein [Alicyclobacillus sp.]